MDTPSFATRCEEAAREFQEVEVKVQWQLGDDPEPKHEESGGS